MTCVRSTSKFSNGNLEIFRIKCFLLLLMRIILLSSERNQKIESLYPSGPSLVVPILTLIMVQGSQSMREC